MRLRLGSAIDRLRGRATPLDDACARIAATNEQTLEWQCDVTRVAAPTGDEGARARWMTERFREIGWTDIQRDAAGNVIVRRHGDGGEAAGDGSPPRQAVWCCAHLDTVFTEREPVVTRQGARLSGPGIGDNGRGLAALLALADALQHVELPTTHDIILAGTVGEEGLGDLRGMKALMEGAVPRPVAVIAIDGAGDDRIVNAALGSTRWRITFTGAGGHSWADFGIANPLHAATAVSAALQAVLLPREPRTTLTVARIGGGESINSIPRECWLEVDLRSLGATVLADLERTMRDTVARIERSENGRRASNTMPIVSRIDLLGDRPCGATPDDAPLVRLAQQATRAIGLAPRLAAGSTDASIPIAMGIPAIAIGAGGRGGGTHTPGEWYDDTDGVRGLQRALRIVVGAAGVRSREARRR
ncbi:MAG: M20/M25/M40 family metallo-hydrolase [Gemmatimonadaceae bacterium]|nr:M20/M25/M40 family metallo-hydrolase [Gemmatimonadaceae bacterium]